MDILKDEFLPLFEKTTGIRTEWVEADFSGWLQKALNDGETKAGAFDIYVMDDLWVPQFAGAGYLANLDEMGFQPDADFIPSGLDLGYWPPKTGCANPASIPKQSPFSTRCPLSATFSCSSIAATSTPPARRKAGTTS